jgi:hypothetical protein
MDSESKESKPTKLQRASEGVHANGVVSARLYYFSAWTDSGCLLGCEHLHSSVISAANCISEAGGYVIAVEKGRLRALDQGEEKLFELAIHGGSLVTSRWVVFEPLRDLKSLLN